MSFLNTLAEWRTPFFDSFFSILTHLGEETVFLAIAIFFFWCVNKREGYYILTVGLVGTVANQFLKLIFRIPRPWVKDPAFKIVESARLEATGFSFPSGHTQNIAGTFGSIAAYSKRRALKIFALIIIVLVAFSRMYLGVHTPSDVIASLCIAALLTFLLYPVFKTEENFERYMPVVVILSALFSLALLIYTLFMPEEGASAKNLYDGMKNAFTLFGCTLGMVIVYILENGYIKFDTHAPWYVQIIKLVLGFFVILVGKGALSELFLLILGEALIARAAAYFFIVLFAGVGWPATFKYFAKIRISPLDKLGEKVKGLFWKK